MVTTLRWLMAVSAVSLLIAAALHAGLVIPGPFDQAALYETGIAVILGVGVALTFIGPAWARWGGLAAMTAALTGACIGLFVALRGLAPDTAPDIVYHVALVGTLLLGLYVAWRVEASADARESA